jgi:hypothetical protein
MRCLQVFSAPDGGVPEHVLRLALGLRERGWQSWVAGPESASNLEALETAGIPVVRLPFRGGYLHPFDDLAVLRALARLIRRRPFDLVYTRSAKADALGRVAAVANGVPVVCNPGGWDFDPAFRRGPGRLVSLSIERMLAARTDAYVCGVWEVAAHSRRSARTPPGPSRGRSRASSRRA